MSVDCQGQLAVLSGRCFLYIVNLETPNEGPRKIARQSKWDIGTVQWSPHESCAHLFAASATAMSVDCQGQLAVLSGRCFLYIVNLETPNEGPRKIARQSKWDIGTVQWSPHESCAHLFAASLNKQILNNGGHAGNL